MFILWQDQGNWQPLCQLIHEKDPSVRHGGYNRRWQKLREVEAGPHSEFLSKTPMTRETFLPQKPMPRRDTVDFTEWKGIIRKDYELYVTNHLKTSLRGNKCHKSIWKLIWTLWWEKTDLVLWKLTATTINKVFPAGLTKSQAFKNTMNLSWSLGKDRRE